MPLQQTLEAALTEATGKPARLASAEPRHGGSINDSRLITLDDGRRYFVKTHPRIASLPGMYAAEFEALALFTEANIIRVPRPVVRADDFLVLEALAFGEAAADWAEQLGRTLALLHQKTQAGQFGFMMDNYLGETVQPNAWSSDWLSFWRYQRLGWQLQQFARQADSDDALLKLGDQLMARLDTLLADLDEPPVLLHGDLWRGNAAADEQGRPLVFDPASYYGQREAEIGMMRLFGGFGPRCEAAYAEVWPFQAEAERRFSLYRLYHELNHLNLFGQPYYAACISTMTAIL